MRLALGSLVAASVLVAGASSASAHPTAEFHACAAHQRVGGSCFARGGAYAYGTTVHLRARVSPAHSAQRALVVRKRPYASTWRVVDEVFISDTGRMRWSWHTTSDDAVQRRPYEFRFRIPEHGLSNEVEVFVVLGE
jgi:hypothetical protein